MLGYFIVRIKSSVSFNSLVCLGSVVTVIASRSTDALTSVVPSSGQVTVTSTDSPTDLVLICRKRYSISKVVRSLVLVRFVQSTMMRLIASIISAFSPDSIARKRSFSSFTRKGLYLIDLPLDGSLHVYCGTFSLGNAIEIHISNFI